MLRPLHQDHVLLFRLLFFGNLTQDWTEFVLRDLGVVRFEPYELRRDLRLLEEPLDTPDRLAHPHEPVKQRPPPLGRVRGDGEGGSHNLFRFQVGMLKQASGGRDGIGAGAQAGAVLRARFIVFPVSADGFEGILLPEQVKHQNHVGLLQNLRRGGQAVAASQIFVGM